MGYTQARQSPLYYTIKNFGSKKVWQKRSLPGIGKKTLANEVWAMAIRF